MLFAIFFPMSLGVIASSMLFTFGSIFSLSGVEALAVFYGLVVALAIILATIPQKRINWSGGVNLN
jgi:ferrous iron transport protein B